MKKRRSDKSTVRQFPGTIEVFFAARDDVHRKIRRTSLKPEINYMKTKAL